MNRMATISALGLLALAGPALAEDFDYNFLDAGLLLADSRGNDGIGIGAAGSTDLVGPYQNATGFGGVSYVDLDGGNLLNLHGGMGFHWPVASKVDFNGGLALEFQKVTGGGSDLGFSLNAGVRARPFAPEWELDGGLQYVDIGQSEDTRVILGTRYTFRPGMSGGIQLNSGDVDYWALTLRWEL
jgi:hypothetical protein